MKAVFPCKGAVVVTKPNVNILANFYEQNLINSKLYTVYSQNDVSVQVGPFNYFPQNSSILLEQDAELLTIQKLNDVLAKTANQPENKVNATERKDVPIDDNFVKDHPFFQSLKTLK